MLNKLSINGNEVVIRKRKKRKHNTPELYLWDITKMAYISSLYPLKNSNKLFHFEVKREVFTLDIETMKIKNEGLYSVELKNKQA